MSGHRRSGGASLGQWLDERTGFRAVLRAALDEHVPGGARWAYVFGSVLTATLVAQAVTGVALMSAYSPSTTTAWASVAHVSFTLSGGWLVRGIHHWGAQAMVVVLAAHLVQTAIFGAYRKPREVNWYFGLGLLMVTLGFALTGYLLPWDQKGYWATRVATNIVGSIPLLGASAQRVLLGGAEYGTLTLTHFYALHVAVLPAAAALLVAGHIALFRRHGVTPPPRADLSKIDGFFPKQLAMDVVASLVVLAVVVALTLRAHGAPLDAPADPGSDYPARPEWYFLALFELLKYFEGALEPIGAVGVPLVAFGWLFAMPLLDTKSNPRLRDRLPWLGGLGALAAGALFLTVHAMRADANDAAFQRARLAADEQATRAAALFRQGVPPEGPLAMLKNDPETRAESLFKKECATCHALGDMRPKDGATAPDLAGYGTKAWVAAVLLNPDADALFGHSPFKGSMPSMITPPKDPEAAAAFTPLKEADRDAIAAFLEVQARGEAGHGMPGEKLVKQRCTSCHRLDGKTDDDDSAAPELRGWASDAWIAAQIENPGGGKAYPKGAMSKDLAGHMPGFADKIAASDRALLASWLGKRARATQLKDGP